MLPNNTRRYKKKTTSQETCQVYNTKCPREIGLWKMELTKDNIACAKCGNLFTCKVHDITQCDCKRIPLSELALQYLATTQQGCLCVNCLQAINHQLNHKNN